MYVKKGPGRNRKFSLPKTKHVREITTRFFVDGLRKLNRNKYNVKRADACTTMYQRNLKKIALYLLEKVSVRNKYKCHDESEYLVAYTETFVLFSLVFLGENEEGDIIKNFLEFITIYFPTNKVIKLAEILLEEGSIEEELKNHVHLIAEMRDKTSKKNFNLFVQNNYCMMKIVHFCQKIFEKTDKDTLKGKARETVQKVLYAFEE